jgi:DNA-binding CsgD family transcriptional regulator
VVQRAATGQAENQDYDIDPMSHVARLSQGQIDCLLLVDKHHSSKEIAVRLGISPHTVDQRIRGALEKLGVDRRGEAARLVAAAVSTDDETYQRLIHQSPHIDASAASGHQEGAVSHQIRHAGRAGEVAPPGVITEQRPDGFGSPLQLPFATRSHPSNEMSIVQRLLWIVLIAMGAAFSAGMYLAGLESLSRLIRT